MIVDTPQRHASPGLDLHGKFEISLEKAADYPLNLVFSNEFRDTLRQYRDDKIGRNSEAWYLFHESRWSIWAWNLRNSSERFSESGKLDSLDKLQSILPANQTDPTCRFLLVARQSVQARRDESLSLTAVDRYIQNANSRSPLACSKEQLTCILTYYQVFPAFIETLCAFRSMDTIPLQLSFRNQKCLRKSDARLQLPRLGRSGYRIQHCFRLLCIENKSEDDMPWEVRHVAAYHSMDVVENRSLWIVIKARASLRERIKEATENYQDSHPDTWKTVSGAFLANMNTHLLIFKWCTENWTNLIDHLELKISPVTSRAKFAPVMDMTAQPALFRKESSMAAQMASRQNTGVSTPASPTVPTANRILSGTWSTRHRRRPTASNPPAQSGGTAMPTPGDTMDAGQLEKMFNIEELQRHHRLGERFKDAMTALEQNTRVMEDFRMYVSGLLESDGFANHVKVDEVRDEVRDNLETMHSLQADLQAYKSRLGSLLDSLEQSISLFNFIIQYKNMQTTEHFAREAKRSADRMEQWTVKMHEISAKTEQETVSMHAITLLTLIFLPGTFVASLLQSGILEFKSAKVWSAGEWDVNLGALKLFCMICFPTMALTLASWLVFFVCYRHRRQEATYYQKTNGSTE